MSNRVWLIDAGHGGMINGKYVTAPDKMFVHPTFTIYEGEVNRKIKDLLIGMLKTSGISYIDLCPSELDIPLSVRADIANKYFVQYGKCAGISIHLNAGGGKGWEVWTGPGQNISDKIATIAFEEFGKLFIDAEKRQDLSDGDPDKENKFYILVKTKSPWILTENFFMDNFEEARKLMGTGFLYVIAKYHFNTIMKAEHLGL